MAINVIHLGTLSAIGERELKLLAALGIRNLADLLSYQPAIDAQLVAAAADGLIPATDARAVLVGTAQRTALKKVLDGSLIQLSLVDARTRDILARLDIDTVNELAAWEAIAEAEDAINSDLEETLEEDPTAPDCVVPRCKKYTRNSKSFTSFVRAEDISDLKIASPSLITPIHRLFNFNADSCGSIYLGYSSAYRQDWFYCGVHLGEPLGSVSLLMGQDSQVSQLDWKRINRATRGEDSRVTEQLVNLLTHQRAVDEVARATAEEHQHGATSSFGANAATAGSFVAAGAVVGGVGGGVSGALAGLVIGNVANSAGAAPTLAGAAVGTAVGSAAGAAAGALVFSGATTLGFIETEADGERSIVGDSGQRIHERSLQNASSIRSFWSNIVTQSIEDEQQRLRTDRVTNYNKIHALNALYFEVLNRYRVNLWLTGIEPLIFIPFVPFQFDHDLLRQYWWILRQYMKDAELVAAIDSYLISLTPVESVLEALEALPRVEEIEATQVRVELDFDGSVLEDLIVTQLTAAGAASAAILGAIGLLGGVAVVGGLLLNTFYNTVKREFIRVTLITESGDVPLSRQSSPNTNPEFVGRYSTNQNVRIEAITGLRVDNDNSSLKLGIPGTEFEIDLSAVAFEKVKARLWLANPEPMIAAVPNIADVADERRIGPETVTVGGNSSETINWPIANTLRTLYSGITEQQKALDSATETQESVEVRIDHLIGFLNANKFGFTRLILQQIEREQVICVLDQLVVGGVDLRSFAGTNPIGFTGGHVILPLKRAPSLSSPAPVQFSADVSKLVQFLEQLLKALEDNTYDDAALRGSLDNAQAFIQTLYSVPRNKEPERTLRERLQALISFLQMIIGNSLPGPISAARTVEQVIVHIKATLHFIAHPTAPASSSSGTASLDLIKTYYDTLREKIKDLFEKQIAFDDVSLPSSAVFMEPVLSNAKGAELYDIRRNSHYDILTSPDIAAADPNVLRGQPVTLTPTVPGASLEQQVPPAYPLPTTLATFAAEAGKLNLDTMLQTNAASLATTLTNLSNLATEMAKAAATLSGDAQKEVLNQAGKMGEMIGSILESSLSDMADLAESMSAPPPDTLEEQGNALNESKKTDKEPIPEDKKEQRKRTMGVPKVRSKTRDYQFQFLFSDEIGRAYDFGEARIVATFFEYTSEVALNGGAPIEMLDGGYLLPETYKLTPGRKATLRIFAKFDGLPELGSTVKIGLPNSPDVVIELQMKSRTETVTETTVSKAVNQVVKNSGFTASLQSTVKAALEQAATLGLELPFKVFDIGVNASASGTTTGGADASVNLAGEYSASEQTTDGTDTSTSTERKFEITIPLFAWKVTVS